MKEALNEFDLLVFALLHSVRLGRLIVRNFIQHLITARVSELQDIAAAAPSLRPYLAYTWDVRISSSEKQVKE